MSPDASEIENRALIVMSMWVARARMEWRYWLRHRTEMGAGHVVAYQSRRDARTCIAHARDLRFAVTGHHGSAGWERARGARYAA